MKRIVAGQSILLAIGLVCTLSVGCGEVTEGETGYQSAKATVGQCNRIVARTLGLTQQCQSECSVEECAELQGTFNEFFGSDCGPAFFAGELNGLAGSALGTSDDPKHIQEVICGAAETCDPACIGVKSVGLCIETEACN